MYSPDRWLVLEAKGIYKLFGTTSGSYLYGDSWRLNSGITEVEDEDDRWLVHGVSGSVYECYKDSCGVAGAYNHSALAGFKAMGFKEVDIKEVIGC